jgi:uncharacterized membrane protein
MDVIFALLIIAAVVAFIFFIMQKTINNYKPVKPIKSEHQKASTHKGRKIVFMVCAFLGFVCIILGFAFAEEAYDTAIYIVGGIIIVSLSLVGDTLLLIRNNLIHISEQNIKNETLKEPDDII